MADFPSWDEYRAPDLSELQALASKHLGLRQEEVSDRGSDIDNRTAVRVFLYQQGVRGVLFQRLVEPFDLGFYLRSDGKSTPIPSLKLRGRQVRWGFRKDIVSVRHDLDYFRGRPGRAAADRWYWVGQLALGESRALAMAEYLGLRVAGWHAWNAHAEKRESVSGYGEDAYIYKLPILVPPASESAE